jgi:hypothetical protein
MGRFRSMLGTVSSNLVMSPAPRRPPVSPLRRAVEKYRATADRIGVGGDALTRSYAEQDYLRGDLDPPEATRRPFPADSSEVPPGRREQELRALAELSAEDAQRRQLEEAQRRREQDARALAELSAKEAQRRREQDAPALAERYYDLIALSGALSALRDLEYSLSALGLLRANQSEAQRSGEQDAPALAERSAREHALALIGRDLEEALSALREDPEEALSELAVSELDRIRANQSERQSRSESER